ncbi:two-component system sensor histidine kinase SenX3 [Homoserinimonas aerilata]|uniref:Sensor-like histidine kinase SenX3 n=1 Tax=Homoserinimonas aerilata TaxID=1162970 RepID=A0A542YG41_9MICO|nr:ATP-binding protein [Homoserinimonas aerilata]TQL47035.1 two-component system sensor histidine kinase SenX3 [Homoserinimonas aerilata]
MEPSLLVALSLVFGVAVGAALVSLVHHAARRGERAAMVVNGGIPDGVSQVLDALESAAVVVDPSNNVLKVSPGALAFGLVGNQVLVHPEMVELVNRVRRSGEPLAEEVVLTRGPYSDASVHLFVRVARLGTRFVLLVAEDRTESYRLDAVRRDFVANISHELKTPIGAVSLLAEALAAASDEPEQVKRFAKRLSKESERLARITREIIELSRLQAADALARPEIVDVDHVVASAIDQNRVIADKHGIRLASGGDAGTRAYGDEDLLIAAVQNLVSNAIQYSPDNSRIGVGVVSGDGVLEISVTDQGIGIEEQDLDRVFERFYRIDPARARNTGGTGLGLSIVKHVAQNHGGDVRVWSQPGKGSTFTIRIPELTDADARLADHDPAPTTKPRRGNDHVKETK